MYSRRPATPVWQAIAVVIGVILFIAMVSQCANNRTRGSVFSMDGAGTTVSNGTTNYTPSGSGTSVSADGTTISTVPWDYRIVEGTVGDLIGGDMTIEPDNQLMANDKNYATGDKVWVLQHMSATLTEDAQGRAKTVLSLWRPIKSYEVRSDAEADLNRLKVRLKTKADLVGVYKTTLGDKSREFAVVELPSGQRVKQPIDDERYAQLKTVKETDIFLEEVHDYAAYDLVYSKFRGWASS
ncbi:hypothetical protein [Cohnella sp. JJ-181]|uniref:hypothetical protein n=1 Tax=Cohnella rhizoplanae TaxID=2974897 RepID=UPI0022FFA339|nr:hypothetical protein [Cohnella sp. JJ-181]CAI6087279.1 hypothetical protein COHCIP112018_05427 [Cohnella sp. JJ-181]